MCRILPCFPFHTAVSVFPHSSVCVSHHLVFSVSTESHHCTNLLYRLLLCLCFASFASNTVVREIPLLLKTLKWPPISFTVSVYNELQKSSMPILPLSSPLLLTSQEFHPYCFSNMACMLYICRPLVWNVFVPESNKAWIHKVLVKRNYQRPLNYCVKKQHHFTFLMYLVYNAFHRPPNVSSLTLVLSHHTRM